MDYNVYSCALVQKDELARGIYGFTLQNSVLAGGVRPGQFVHVLVPGKTLRRPISVCDADPAAGTVRLVFQVRGEGTAIMAQAEPGDVLDLLAPLGRGFSRQAAGLRPVFVGGGIGVPPLLFAARQAGGGAAVLGFRNQDAVILKEDFIKAGCRVFVTTEDGSAGEKGLVTGPLATLLQEQPSAVFACGPTPMLRAVARLAKEYGSPCEVSLEERMACGVGACLGCACKLIRDGKEFYGHVCKDGPVFPAEEVVW
jgi:dihydroorotate dehydrogenase electron transfer subunit